MKKIVIIMLPLILLISCNNHKDEVEIIKNIDREYFDYESVTVPAMPMNNDFEEKFHTNMLKVVKNWYERNNKKVGMYSIEFVVFIDKNGNVEKIEDGKKIDPSHLYPKSPRAPIDTVKKFQWDDEVFKEILHEAKSWEFEPAYFNGSKIKYKNTFLIIYDVDRRNFQDEFSVLFCSYIPSIQNFLVEVEEMPSPIGGVKGIQEKIIYPEIAQKAGIEGRVYLKVYINEKGDVVETVILKGLDAGCSEAAANAVKNTKFIPGKQHGRPVKVQVTIPILFKLEAKQNISKGKNEMYKILNDEYFNALQKSLKSEDISPEKKKEIIKRLEDLINSVELKNPKNPNEEKK